MENKNILHVVNVFFVIPYFFGDQFLYFRGHGYNFHIICSPSENLDNYSKDKGFQYEEIPITREFSVIQDFKSLIAICKYIRKNNIQTVVGHTPKGGLLAMIAAFITRVPSRIYFRHGLMYETSKGIKRQILLFAERLTALLANKIVCVSPSVYKKSLSDKLNQEKKQIVLGKGTCGGVDSLQKFNPDKINLLKRNELRESLGIAPDDIVVGYCGRLVKDKGIAELVDAYEMLNLEKPAKLLLIGGFEKRDSLSDDMVNKIKNNRNIIVTGVVYHEIEYYYSLMNVFVLPSFREGFGMSVLEASSMRIPVLTTRVTGCVDSIIEGETGFFVSNTAESIRQGIESLLKRDDLEQIRLQGRNFVVDNFDNLILWEIMDKELY